MPATRTERAGLLGTDLADGDRSLTDALWRGVDVYRPLAWAYAVLAAVGQHPMGRPWVAVVVLAVLGLWSLVIPFVGWRSRTSLVLETLLACVGVLLTPVAIGVARWSHSTLPALWAAAPVMGWAVVAGARGGVLSALVISIVDVVEVVEPTEGTIYNSVTLLFLGACLGLCTDMAHRAQRALAEVLRIRAETAERERLARTIHDGVLQALAFIHRRGVQLGGEAAELGEIAAAQERELRGLALGPTRRPGRAPVDLRAVLRRVGGPRVTVSRPAGEVLLEADRAEELVAAVEAALANVEAHAGAGARAWVLVEDLGDVVVATIRDDGVGYPAGRLAEAAAEGRLGVVASIDGRVRHLGGSVAHRSTPGHGTTVELTVPKTAPAQQGGRLR